MSGRKAAKSVALGGFCVQSTKLKVADVELELFDSGQGGPERVPFCFYTAAEVLVRNSHS